MSNRLLIGRHPATGQIGCWLTRAGIDVLNPAVLADPDQMLISSSIKVEQVIAAGVVVLGSGSGIFVPFDFPLAQTPGVVIFPSNSTGAIQSPAFHTLLNNGSLFANATAAPTGISLSISGISGAIFYVALARLWA